jgi:glutamate-5-semialdehyde dehydrogenase
MVICLAIIGYRERLGKKSRNGRTVKIMTSIKEIVKAAKKDSFKMAALPEEVRNRALKDICVSLKSKSSQVVGSNKSDLKRGEESNLPSPLMKRLKFDEKKIEEVVKGIEELIALPDPLGKNLLKRELDKDLVLNRVTCSIGVIGVIFESRPDALVQIASLCLKSGNCAVLKGGSEAMDTNRILFEIIHDAGVNAGLPKGFLTLVESRSDIVEILGCHESIDLIIPRGSNEFVKYIMDNSDIPVMGHADGICHVYVDSAADLKKAVPIINDSKTQYVAVCNAVETVLVHKDVKDQLLPELQRVLVQSDVIIKGDQATRDVINVKVATDEDFKTEYLDYAVSIKVVSDMDEAIDHINTYGSHHTDCIVTEDSDACHKFMTLVDSAGVYNNCSTRFADGFRYGFGAEVGVSTGKLHARGPVGLEGLVTYKYELFGNGNIVDDYAEGRKEFHFRDL